MTTQKLPEEERQRMIAILTELEQRGLSIPEEANPYIAQKFHTDSNGYFVRRDGKLFNANEHQKKFIDSNARFVAIFSGRGGGKTSSAAQKALRKIEQGLDGAVLNPSFENFKISTWPEFREWIPWDMVSIEHRYRSEPTWEPRMPFTLTFVNGTKVICKGLHDSEGARGPNINWLWYDEAGLDKDGLAWQIANASVRIGKETQAWISTTPKGKLHWTYNFFIEQNIPEDAVELFAEQGGGRDLVYYEETTIQDNMENLDPGFVAAMMAAYPSGWLRQQELFGKFVDEGGTLGDRTWFQGKIIPRVPDLVTKRLRYWDLAASEKKISGRKLNDPDETVGTRLSWDGELTFTIEHQHSGFWAWKDLKAQIVSIAETDGPFVPIIVEQEPGAGGKNQVAELELYVKEQLGMNYKVVGHRPEGDKVQRANSWFAEAANGQWYMVYGNWNAPFLDQLDTFTGSGAEHDDKVDSVSGARQFIAPFKVWKEIEFLHL